MAAKVLFRGQAQRVSFAESMKGRITIWAIAAQDFASWHLIAALLIFCTAADKGGAGAAGGAGVVARGGTSARAGVARGAGAGGGEAVARCLRCALLVTLTAALGAAWC